MNRLFFGGAALALAATAAVAQTAAAPASPIDTMLTIPWGDWLYNSATAVIAVLGALITWGLRFLPARILAVVQTAQLDQLLLKAIDYGVNTTKDAAKGKALTVDVANPVLKSALQYAVDNAPGWMISWAGGEEGLRVKIIARLNVDEKAAL